MSGPTPALGAALVRRRLAGVAFLCVLAMLLGLSVAMYQKAFTKVVKVTLLADRAGNQLSAHADVKVRGLVIGTVRDVRANADGAIIDLALDPDQIEQIPENVSAQMLPKTLFGEKYVELVLPSAPEGHLRAGDVIPQDRSTTALETERVLNDLLPLLQSLHPQQLSITLNALSSALRGRGDRLGHDLVTAGAYFRQLNPALPDIGRDFRGVADLSDTLTASTPDLLRVLDNLSASSRNLVVEKADLDTFLTSTQGFAATARSIVAQNESRLVNLSKDSTPVLNLLARYSAELPCFFGGLAAYEPGMERVFGGGQAGLHITFEVVTDNGGFVPGQEPKNRDTRGPHCWGLPHPKGQAPDDKFDDGYRTSTSPSRKTFSGPALAAVAAPALGVPADSVPDVVGLLLGPVAGGNAVGLS